MNTTRKLLEAVRAKHHASWYGMEDILGVTKPTLTRYRKGHGYFDDEVALRVADELKLPPAHVLSIVAAERAKSEAVRKAWQKAAAATALGVLALLSFDHGAQFGSEMLTAANDLTALHIIRIAGCLAALALAIALWAYYRRPRPPRYQRCRDCSHFTPAFHPCWYCGPGAIIFDH